MAKNRRVQDHYGLRAKRENYPARSVYKLEEIDRRVKLIRSRDFVLDLGAAPGSWTMYAAQKVGPEGKVVAVDRSPLAIGLPSHVIAITADVLDCDVELLKSHGKETGFDAVISDMAPHTTGHRFVDQQSSFRLFCRALEIASILLRRGGRFAGKIFHGGDFESARAELRELFVSSRVIKPASSRSESYEIYLVGLERK